MLKRIPFSDLTGWFEDDYLEAFRAFRKSYPKHLEILPKSGAFGISAESLNTICQSALKNPATSSEQAREFFERNFSPVLIEGENTGFLTGYYEPLVRGSLVPTKEFQTPIYGNPPDLVKLTRGNYPDNISEEFSYARLTSSGFAHFPDRKAIEEGALAGLGLELAYVESAVESFFIHLQGSAKIELTDGSMLRLTFASKNGYPYTPIGKFLIEEGIISKEDMTAERLRTWLENNDRASELMARNRSYVFFKVAEELDADEGPIGAAGIPLVSGRSLAIDRRIHTFGTPIHICANMQEVNHGFKSGVDSFDFCRLMIAHDTGTAIIGKARGDLFVGTGENAALIAGQIKHPATFHVLVPKIDSV